MNCFERIETLAKCNSLNIHTLEKELGLYNGAISRLKYTKHGVVSPNIANSIAEYFGVTSEYILYGEPTKDTLVTINKDNQPKDEFETVLLESYRGLSTNDKIKLLQFVSDLSAKK